MSDHKEPPSETVEYDGFKAVRYCSNGFYGHWNVSDSDGYICHFHPKEIFEMPWLGDESSPFKRIPDRDRLERLCLSLHAREALEQVYPRFAGILDQLRQYPIILEPKNQSDLDIEKFFLDVSKQQRKL